MVNTRSIGAYHEQRVADELVRRGYRIVEQNFCCRFGEIDIIARQGKYFVFVEVKYRSNASYGTPMEAVNARKQRRICNTASYYLYRRRRPADTPCRFDVAAVSDTEISILENAFPYVGDFRL